MVDAHAQTDDIHKRYVEAINTNDVDEVLALATDDVVFQHPGSPEVVGKDALREWIQGYLDAFSTSWVKTSIGLTVSGDLAAERYSYRGTDTDKANGAVSVDEGKGIIVFRRESDGEWRVYLDGWSSDPASGAAS